MLHNHMNVHKNINALADLIKNKRNFNKMTYKQVEEELLYHTQHNKQVHPSLNIVE